MSRLYVLLIVLFTYTLQSQSIVSTTQYYQGPQTTLAEAGVGASRIDQWKPLLTGKTVGVVSNQTGVIYNKQGGLTHVIDTMISNGINVVKIFAPEHGFRGTADAGEKLDNSIDTKTGKPIVSLYGKNKKPSKTDLEGIDLMVYDIQDVGARFFTYISTLHYVMEACAEDSIPLIILDRPNPLGFYYAGPVLDTAFQSFVGMHPVALVHGLTVGEYAQMINGEGWLANKAQCQLTVITCANYKHTDLYQLPNPPSPNLQTMAAVYLYPSLCLFEGTNVSVGRGTKAPFTQYGSPYVQNQPHSFTPKPGPGSKDPLYNGIKCFGENLNYDTKTLGARYFTLEYLSKAYQNSESDKNTFFNSFFEKLVGNNTLRMRIETQYPLSKIYEDDWAAPLAKYALMRQKYLLYPEN